MRQAGFAAGVITAALALAACSSGAGAPGTARTEPRGPSTQAIHDPAGNKAIATAESRRLVGLMPLPTGSTRFDGTPPSTLDGPATGMDSGSQLVDTATYWQVPAPKSTVVSWATAHKPAAFTVEGTGTGNDADGVSFTGPKDPAAPQNDPGTLAVSAVATSATTSLWRIDGMVVWYDPTPVRDRSDGPRVHITLTGGCPATLPLGTGITNTGPGLDDALLPPGEPSGALLCQYPGMNPQIDQHTAHRLFSAAQAGGLAAQVRALRVGSSGGMYNCPMDDEQRDVIVFAMPQGDVDIMWSITGCQSVGNGHIIAFMGSLTLPR